MNKDFEEIKLYNIETALADLAQYQAQVLNSEKGTTVPVGCLNEYDYVKNYIYKLKADNKALNLIVDKLTAKEEKQEVNKDKWVKIQTYSGSVILRVQDIAYVENNGKQDTYELYLKGKNFHYLLRGEAYEQLTELLVGNKENE